MKKNQRTLYDELIRFYLLATDNDKVALKQMRASMGAMVRKLRKSIPANTPVKSKIRQLLRFVYDEWGFRCDAETYFYTRNLYLPYVLEMRVGMPVVLGAIVLYLAEKLALPLYPVNFPTQLILRAEVEGGPIFIDPWDGRLVSLDKLQKLYEGAFGFGASPEKLMLEQADLSELIDRFQQLVKNTLIREEHNDVAYKYVESLISCQNNPYDIRDRGLILAQMGAYSAAINDLEYFVDHCPEDPTAFILKNQLGELKAEWDHDVSFVH